MGKWQIESGNLMLKKCNDYKICDWVKYLTKKQVMEEEMHGQGMYNGLGKLWKTNIKAK